ncbi:DNA methylase [Amycolatopsis sp. NPDC088138]|uniref:DNA methylase n=1 Tax=Amycolatopsis sp. NPDC088138 TaxID=3363938 RepID=UPI00381900D9
MRDVIVDGYACAGGAARGYWDAGYDVIGVELHPRDNYPYPCYRGDALETIPWLVTKLTRGGRRVAAVHTSPPCQDAIAITAGNRCRDGWEDNHVDLIPDTREMLARVRAEHGVPTIIENGVSKRLRKDLMLCGLMFRLPTFRHRYFELDGFTVSPPRAHEGLHKGHRTIGWRHGHIATPEPSACPGCGEWHRGTVYGVYGDGGGKPSILESQLALGLHHTDDRLELNEAIPPAYTRHIGLSLRDLEQRAAA